MSIFVLTEWRAAAGRLWRTFRREAVQGEKHVAASATYPAMAELSLRYGLGLALVACAAAEAGCGQAPQPVSIAAAAPLSSGLAAAEAPPATPPTPPAPSGDAAAAHGSIDIQANVRYPTLRPEFSPLDQAMHAFADAKKAELLDELKKTKPADDHADRRGRLNLEFTLATQTQDFVSALGEGQGDIAGEHPIALRATFTQHLPSAKIVALTDLFADPDAALKILSDEAKRRLEADFEARLRGQNLADKQLDERLKAMHEWVERGTAAKAENFRTFLVDGVVGKAIGITLMFPPEQVAAEAEGPQQVDVPVKLFYAAVKPEYRDGFDKVDAVPVPVPTPQSLASGSR